MKKIEKFIKKTSNNIRKIAIGVVTNPKRFFILMINRIVEMIKNNILMIVFILVSLFASTLLR